MKVYTVSKSHVETYADTLMTFKVGCFAKYEDALKCANEAFVKLQKSYASDIAEYKDLECGDGGLYTEEDHEHGYYCMEYGLDENACTHTVWVDDWEVTK